MKKRALKRNNIIYLSLVLLFSAATVVLTYSNYHLKNPVTEENLQDSIAQFRGELKELIETYRIQIEDIESTREYKSDSTEFVLLKKGIIDRNERAILHLQQLLMELKGYHNSKSFAGLRSRKSLLEEDAVLIKRQNQVVNAIGSKISAIRVLKGRLDSLDREIETAKRQKTKSYRQVQELLKERQKLMLQLQELRAANLRLITSRDSLTKIVHLKDSISDTLSKQLWKVQEDYSNLEKSAKMNADLATRLEIWYYVKDKMKKPRRRFLSEDEGDYNKGREIKTIIGQFSLSYEVFEPFKVANIYLYKTSGNESLITEAKITVREQESGEFSLLVPKGLEKGNYEVRIRYNGQEVLSQKFYVTH